MKDANTTDHPQPPSGGLGTSLTLEAEKDESSSPMSFRSVSEDPMGKMAGDVITFGMSPLSLIPFSRLSRKSMKGLEELRRTGELMLKDLEKRQMILV